MKHAFIAALACALSLSACSKTVDERFAEMCAEQLEVGFAHRHENLCATNGKHLTDDEKEMLLQVWGQIQDQQELVDRLESKVQANGGSVE